MREGDRSQRRRAREVSGWSDVVTDFEDEAKRGPEAGNAGSFRKLEKARNQILLSPAPPEPTQPWEYRDFSPVRPISDL